jgi:hypothetical protein
VRRRHEQVVADRRVQLGLAGPDDFVHAVPLAG